MNRVWAFKEGQLQKMLAQNGLDAVVITLQRNLCWLSGMRTHINVATEQACCMLVVTSSARYVLVNNIEAERLRMEEDTNSDWFQHLTDVLVWPWDNPAQRDKKLKECLDGKRHVKWDTELEEWFAAARTLIHPDEYNAWRQLGRGAEQAIEQTALSISKGQTEFEIAALLVKNSLERELEPLVYLTAVDERVSRFRHPLPTALSLERYVMLVLCVRKQGKIVSVSRLVHFGQPPAPLLDRQRAVAEIDARVNAATRPGIKLDTLYAKIKQFYAEAGYPREEEKHHQGGITGYATREMLANPFDNRIIQANQVVAWNPTLPAVKSEDTLWVGEHSSEFITCSSDRFDSVFPMLEIKVDGRVWPRPGILVR